MSNIVLERVLSLIPKKENGRFKHGAKKEFAVSIGYTDGNIVSMWINGTSDSYLGKLYEIAAVYNVSVEWLRGETDEKRQKNSTAESGADLRLLTPDRYEEFLQELSFAELTELMAKCVKQMEQKGKK